MFGGIKAQLSPFFYCSSGLQAFVGMSSLQGETTLEALEGLKINCKCILFCFLSWSTPSNTVTKYDEYMLNRVFNTQIVKQTNKTPKSPGFMNHRPCALLTRTAQVHIRASVRLSLGFRCAPKLVFNRHIRMVSVVSINNELVAWRCEHGWK